MEHNERARLLERIAEIQDDNGGDNAPRGTIGVTVQIGHTDDDQMIHHDSVFIQDAPARVLDVLDDDGYALSVGERGVRVRDHRR
jgi:hypothetical protein